MPRPRPLSRRSLIGGAATAGLGWAASGCAIPAGGTTPGSGGAAASAATPSTPTSSTPSPSPTTPAASPTPTTTTPAGALAVLPDARGSLDAPLVVKGLPLINRNHPVSEAFAPTVTGDYQLAPAADKAYRAMTAAATQAGLAIIWRVGYRSYATQTELSKNPPTAYGDEADSYVAKPGQSEHQAGVAVDVASADGYGTRFPETKEFAWLRANAHRYGFILRYPDGKTDLTGYHYEPWHYRYVGTDAAAAFGPNSTLTLEEYLGGR